MKLHYIIRIVKKEDRTETRSFLVFDAISRDHAMDMAREFVAEKWEVVGALVTDPSV